MQPNYNETFNGMLLIDYLAGQVASGIWATCHEEIFLTDPDYEKIAEYSYAQAAALIEERKKYITQPETVTPTAPHKLNGIDGDTYVICETEAERNMVMEVCKAAGWEVVGDTDADELVVRLEPSTNNYCSLRISHYKYPSIPASQLLALNTPNPETHSANIV